MDKVEPLMNADILITKLSKALGDSVAKSLNNQETPENKIINEWNDDERGSTNFLYVRALNFIAKKEMLGEYDQSYVDALRFLHQI